MKRCSDTVLLSEPALMKDWGRPEEDEAWRSLNMETYVALLRGINVGGRVVKMAELKACLEGLGLETVSTLLQSGNVTFQNDSNDLAGLRAKIETAVGQKFNYPAKILVYPIDYVKKVTAAYPFDASDEAYQHYVIFMEPGLAKQLADDATGLDAKIDALKLGDQVLYWRVAKGLTLKTPFAKFLVKAKYKEGHTVRNIKTLEKIITHLA